MAKEIVNLPARRAFAESLRHFASGVISVDEYESSWGRISRFYGDDSVVDRIFDIVADSYSDLHSGKLRGKHRLSPEARRYIAQSVLLLRTSDHVEECRWVEPRARREFSAWKLAWGGTVLLAWIALILAPVVLLCAGLVLPGLVIAGAWLVYGVALAIENEFRLRRSAYAVLSKPFDLVNPWPFMTREQLSAARKVPTYFCGARSVSFA